MADEKTKAKIAEISAFKDVKPEKDPRAALRQEYDFKIGKTQERVEFLEGLMQAYKDEGIAPYVQLGGLVDDLELLEHDMTAEVLELLDKLYRELLERLKTKRKMYG